MTRNHDRAFDGRSCDPISKERLPVQSRAGSADDRRSSSGIDVVALWSGRKRK